MQYTDGENCVIDGRKKEDKSGYASEIERILDNSIRHIRENNREKMQEDLLILKNIFQICEFSREKCRMFLKNWISYRGLIKDGRSRMERWTAERKNGVVFRSG